MLVLFLVKRRFVFIFDKKKLDCRAPPPSVTEHESAFMQRYRWRHKTCDDVTAVELCVGLRRLGVEMCQEVKGGEMCDVTSATWR